MTAFRVSAIAGERLDEIFVYTRDTWGQEQAETDIRRLFACFDTLLHERMHQMARFREDDGA